MKPLKFLWSALKLSCSVIILSGCVAGLTTPVTVLPLIIISIVLLIPAPSLDRHWRTGWEILTAALLVQASLFGILVLASATAELEKVVKRLALQRGFLAAILSARKQPYIWVGVKRGLLHLTILSPIAFLPPAFLAGLLYLWRQGQQTWANLLLLPFLLILASLMVWTVSSGSRRKPTPGRRLKPPPRGIRERLEVR
jgi:hypothetical protein